jgi:DNA-binding beta-propeller fold protein YncE
VFKLPFSLRPLARILAFGATALALLHSAAASAADVLVQRVWQFDHKMAMTGQKSEIVAYDRATDTLWVAGTTGVDVLSRVSGQRIANIPVANFGAVNSVAVHKGLAAMAIESVPDRTVPGIVVFFDTRTRQQLGAPVVVGSLPDMVTFTPDGRRVLVANEGTPNPRPTPTALSAKDPVGSVSVIDVATRSVTTLPITPAIAGYETLRLFPAKGSLPTQPATFSSYDPEPEYIAVDKSGKYAYVTLQEANGVAVLNLRTLAFERIFNLGLKDFSLPGNQIDPNDRDGKIELRSVNVKGLYQPDTIATYQVKGRTYLVMANEGDARDNGDFDSEDERRGGAGSGLTKLTDDPDLARLNLSNVDSVRGGPLVKFGGHSFSIRDTRGNIVYDSGSILDRESIRLGADPANPSAATNTLYDDGRSDNKGMEPEGVALLRIKGRVLAFIGLERGKAPKSAFAIFDITDPAKVEYIDMVVSEGDTSPEGLAAFKAGSRYYVAVANEVSDTTSLFEIRLDKGKDRDDEDGDDDE